MKRDKMRTVVLAKPGMTRWGKHCMAGAWGDKLTSGRYIAPMPMRIAITTTTTTTRTTPGGLGMRAID